MPFMLMTCRCGHQADIDEFTRTPVTGELPKNVFQCPRCHLAVERKVTGPGTLYDSGLFVSGPIELVPVQARL